MTTDQSIIKARAELEAAYNKDGDLSLMEVLKIASMDGAQDETCGTVDTIGWHGLFKAEAFILHCDSQGFYDYCVYDTVAGVMVGWQRVLDCEQEYLEGEETE